MADKVLRWYIDGIVSRSKTEVGGTYRLDNDYYPIEVSLTCRVAGTGTEGTVIDINDDGESIFTTKPSLLPHNTQKVWSTVGHNVIREGSIITLDIDSINNLSQCRDLTVELYLDKS